MRLYPVIGGIIDVFHGDGWLDWTRIIYTDERRIAHAGGRRLTIDELKLLYSILEEEVK